MEGKSKSSRKDEIDYSCWPGSGSMVYSDATVNRPYTIDHSMLESIFEWFSNRSAIPPLMWRDRKVFGMVEAWSQGRFYSKSCQGHWETLGDLFETPHAWNKDPALPGRPARAPGRHPDLPVPADSISQEISKVFLWSASTLNVRDLVQWHRSVSPPEDLQVRSISVA